MQSGRSTQRYNSLIRRHASLTRKNVNSRYLSSDTKSVRSLRSLNRNDHAQFKSDTQSLPGARQQKISQHTRSSPYDILKTK